MKIDLARMDPDGEQFDGEDAPSVLALPPEEVRAVSPIAYSFRAVLVSGELIVSGRVWMDVDLLPLCRALSVSGGRQYLSVDYGGRRNGGICGLDPRDTRIYDPHFSFIPGVHQRLQGALCAMRGGFERNDLLVRSACRRPVGCAERFET